MSLEMQRVLSITTSFLAALGPKDAESQPAIKPSSPISPTSLSYPFHNLTDDLVQRGCSHTTVQELVRVFKDGINAVQEGADAAFVTTWTGVSSSGASEALLKEYKSALYLQHHRQVEEGAASLRVALLAEVDDARATVERSSHQRSSSSPSPSPEPIPEPEHLKGAHSAAAVTILTAFRDQRLAAGKEAKFNAAERRLIADKAGLTDQQVLTWVRPFSLCSCGERADEDDGAVLQLPQPEPQARAAARLGQVLDDDERRREVLAVRDPSTTVRAVEPGDDVARRELVVERVDGLDPLVRARGPLGVLAPDTTDDNLARRVHGGVVVRQRELWRGAAAVRAGRAAATARADARTGDAVVVRDPVPVATDAPGHVVVVPVPDLHGSGVVHARAVLAAHGHVPRLARAVPPPGVRARPARPDGAGRVPCARAVVPDAADAAAADVRVHVHVGRL